VADPCVPSYNLADLFEAIADADPDRLALATSGGARLGYAALDRRANRFAHAVHRLGVRRGERVAVLARNGVEWVEAVLGCFKLGALPVNVNYRYRVPEIRHVLRDAEPAAVVVDADLAEAVAECLPDLPLAPAVLVLGGGPRPAGMLDYERELAGADPGRGFEPRSGEDGYLLYTGGTTGLPKGVLWTHENLLFGALGGGGGLGEPISTPTEVLRHVREPAPAWLALAPLMHGNGQWAVLRAWSSGGTAVLWTGPRFDPDGIWATVAELRVVFMIIVGDAMARPLAEALHAHPDRWDLTALRVLASGGAVLSASTKSAVGRRLPHVTIIDGYGASETGSGGTRLGPTADGLPVFDPTPGTAVLDDDLAEAPVGRPGMLAVRGPIPTGYWRDPARTAEVFRVAPDGTRWSVPGDHAVRNADGTVTLLGRGSLSINTGGEKVFPDEVESVLKDHPAVDDALVVGLPDAERGELVAAVVSVRPGATVDLDALHRHARDSLAGYKLPRVLVLVDEVVRSPAGKADYRWARDTAAARTDAEKGRTDEDASRGTGRRG
jgi:acyl-CoA synthetase (AMP-forming)/AMP-acid ligase II